jgi:hypothetical protein
LPPTKGSGSGVLDRRLGNPPEDRPPGNAADLSTMHRLITRGAPQRRVRNAAGSLRAKYQKEYAELKADAQGQGNFCRG